MQLNSRVKELGVRVRSGLMSYIGGLHGVWFFGEPEKVGCFWGFGVSAVA